QQWFTVQTELFTNFEKFIFVFVNRIILCTLIGLFGIVANVINMAVFVKQGLNNSMNISLFALSISDLLRILTVQWLNICSNPYIDQLNVPIVFTDIQYLTAGWPTGCANRITMFITAYITAERSLCLAVPLKIKRWVTPRRAVAALVVIGVINALGLVPEYASVYLDWRFNPARNRTMLSLAFGSSRPATQGVVFTIHALLIVLALTVVILFTSILVIQLRRSSKWRAVVTSKVSQNEAISNRDRKTVDLVVLVAGVMVVCYTPTVVLSLVSTFVPDFSVAGRQVNVFHATWSIGYLLGVINASVNIFIYYKMSSKYRKTFNDLFSCQCRYTFSSVKMTSIQICLY
ncbi:unnamed protein product, partial [Lymnaea stagnalis]